MREGSVRLALFYQANSVICQGAALTAVGVVRQPYVLIKKLSSGRYFGALWFTIRCSGPMFTPTTDPARPKTNRHPRGSDWDRESCSVVLIKRSCRSYAAWPVVRALLRSSRETGSSDRFGKSSRSRVELLVGQQSALLKAEQFLPNSVRYLRLRIGRNTPARSRAAGTSSPISPGSNFQEARFWTAR